MNARSRSIAGCKKEGLVDRSQTQEEEIRMTCGHAAMPYTPTTEDESNGRRLKFSRSITGRFHQDASLDRATYLKKVQDRRAAYIANLDELDRLREGGNNASSLSSSDLLIDVLVSDVDHSICDDKSLETAAGATAVVLSSQSVRRGITSARFPCPTTALPKRPSTTTAAAARSPSRPLGAASPVVMRENRQAANGRAIQVYSASVCRRSRPPRRPGSTSPRRPDSTSPRRLGSASPRGGSRRVRWAEGRLLSGERRRATAPEGRRGRIPWSLDHTGAGDQTFSAVPRPGEMGVEGDEGDGPDWQQVPVRPLGGGVGSGGAGYSRPVSAFAGRRDEEHDLQHENHLSDVSGTRREQGQEGLENRAITASVVEQDTKAEERPRRSSTCTRRSREVEETPSMQRARLLELRTLSNEKKELEAQLAEVKLLMRVATSGKVCWKAAARDLPLNGSKVRKRVRRGRKKRRPSTAPSVERARDGVTTTKDTGKLKPAESHRKAELGVPSERAGKKVGETPTNKETLGRGKRSPKRGARETRHLRSDNDDDAKGEAGTMRQPSVTFGACPMKDRPAKAGGVESTFRETANKDARAQVHRPKSASHRPKSASRQPMARALASPVVPETVGTGMKAAEANIYETRGVNGVPMRPLSARRSGRSGKSLDDSDGRSTRGWGGHKRGRLERDGDKQEAVTVSSSRRQRFVASMSAKEVAASEPRHTLDRKPPERKGAEITPSVEDVADGYEDDFDAVSASASRAYASDFERFDNEQNNPQTESGDNQGTSKKGHRQRVRKHDEQQLRAVAGGGASGEGEGEDYGDSLERASERYHRATADNVLVHDDGLGDGLNNASVNGGSGDASSWDQWTQQDELNSANEEKWSSLREGSVGQRRNPRDDAVDNRHNGVGSELSSSYDELDTGDAMEISLPRGIESKDGNIHLDGDANIDEERVSTAPVSEGGSSLYDVLLRVSSSDESWSLESSVNEQSETMRGNSRSTFSMSHAKMGVNLGDTIVGGKASTTAVESSSDGSSMYESLSSSSTAKTTAEVGPVEEVSSPHPLRVRDLNDARIVTAVETPPSSRGAFQVSGNPTRGMGEPREALLLDTRIVPANRSGSIVGDKNGDGVENNRYVVDGDESFNESLPYDKARRLLPHEGSLAERVSDTLEIVAGATAGDQGGFSFGFGEGGYDVEGNVENTGSFDEWSPGGHPQQGSLDEGSLDEHAFDGQPPHQDAITARQGVVFSGGEGDTVDDELENKLSFDELSLVGTTRKKATGEEGSGGDIAFGEQLLVEHNTDSTRDKGIDRAGEHGNMGPFDGHSLDDRRHREEVNEGSLDQPLFGNEFLQERQPEAAVSGDQATNYLGDNSGLIIQDEPDIRRLLDDSPLDKELNPEFPGESSQDKRLLDQRLIDQRRLVGEATAGDQGVDRAGRRSRPSENFLENTESFDELTPKGKLRGELLDEGARADSSLDELPLADQVTASDQGGGPVGGGSTGHEGGRENIAFGEQFIVERDIDGTRDQGIDRPGEHGNKGPFDGHSLDDRRHREDDNEESLDHRLLGNEFLHERPSEAAVSVDQETNDLGDNRGLIIQGEIEIRRLLDDSPPDTELNPAWSDNSSEEKRLLDKRLIDQRRLVGEATAGDQGVDGAGLRSRPRENFLENGESFDELTPKGKLRGELLDGGARADSSLDELPIADQVTASDQGGGPTGGSITGREGGMENKEPLDESSLEEFEPQQDALDHHQPSDIKQSAHNQQPEHTKQEHRKDLDDGDSLDGNSLGIGSSDDAREKSGDDSRQPTSQDGSLDEYLYDDNSFEELSFDELGSSSLDGGGVDTLDGDKLSTDSLLDEQSLGEHSVDGDKLFDEQSL